MFIEFFIFLWTSLQTAAATLYWAVSWLWQRRVVVVADVMASKQDCEGRSRSLAPTDRSPALCSIFLNKIHTALGCKFPHNTLFLLSTQKHHTLRHHLWISPHSSSFSSTMYMYKTHGSKELLCLKYIIKY